MIVGGILIYGAVGAVVIGGALRGRKKAQAIPPMQVVTPAMARARAKRVAEACARNPWLE